MTGSVMYNSPEDHPLLHLLSTRDINRDSCLDLKWSCPTRLGVLTRELELSLTATDCKITWPELEKGVVKEVCQGTDIKSESGAFDADHSMRLFYIQSRRNRLVSPQVNQSTCKLCRKGGSHMVEDKFPLVYWSSKEPSRLGV
ncbi:2932_t:CDS:2 [Acaulospora colombiana]|uniref:2932_t:CDS:1 n=1 Tax=Acaulospora colombiana TaxID=27376 RepID=A0ACA9MMI6_9GLOM|nr:2932_t:CDS:2 [Acaulospora colombiana]